MILYINKVKNGLEFSNDSMNADYQMIISRINTKMKVNEKLKNGKYKNIPLTSKKVKELNIFVLKHFKNVVQELDSLIETIY